MRLLHEADKALQDCQKRGNDSSGRESESSRSDSTARQQQQQQEVIQQVSEPSFWRSQALNLYKRKGGFAWLESFFEDATADNDKPGFWGLVSVLLEGGGPSAVVTLCGLRSACMQLGISSGAGGSAGRQHTMPKPKPTSQPASRHVSVRGCCSPSTKHMPAPLVAHWCCWCCCCAGWQAGSRRSAQPLPC